MKKNFTLVLVWMMFAVSVHAAPTLPSSSVWATSTQTKAGSEVTLNALVYNSATEQATVVVEFTTDKKVIATADPLTIDTHAARTATAVWKLPESPTIVTASVKSAQTKSKKDIPLLKGTVGTISVGGTALQVPVQATGFASKIVTPLEDFRLRKLEYFTALKKAHSGVIGSTTIKDIGTIITPDVPTGPGDTEGQTPEEKAKTMGYITYGYASAGAAFFSHKALYYVTIILLALFVVRFIFSRFLA